MHVTETLCWFDEREFHDQLLQSPDDVLILVLAAVTSEFAMRFGPGHATEGLALAIDQIEKDHDKWQVIHNSRNSSDN